MNIVILDDYQDAVRKLDCAHKLNGMPIKVHTNSVKVLHNLQYALKTLTLWY